MADDYSWIKPATGSIANMLGLNPEAAAKGRALQSQQEYNAARTANTQADTGLSDYRRRLLEAQAATQAAMAGQHKETAGKTAAERAGIELATQSRQRLNELYSSGALVQNEDGSVTISPKAVGGIAGSLAALQTDPVKTMQSIREVQAGASTNPRFAAQTRGIAGIFRPDAATTVKEGQQIMGAKQAAAQNQAIEVAKIRGSIAQNIGGAPRAIDLTRAANDAVKLGPAYVQNRYGSEDFPVPKDMVAAITSAAQERYPQLPINQAIDKIIEESKIQFAETGNWSPYANQTVPRVPDPNGWLFTNKDADMSDLSKLLAGSAPAAPATHVVKAPAAPASSNGVTMERMQSAPGQSAAPAAPATPVAPAAQAIAPAPAQAGRVAGQVYNTPKGPLKWTGTGWVSP